MKLLKILPIIFLLLLVPTKSFADMPEIKAGQTYFDIFKGHYVLKDDVKVVMNNHGWKASITSNEARVNVVNQKCWALGKVNFKSEDYTLKCETAYMQWQVQHADLTGGIDFESKNIIKVKSDTATFNWGDKIADFYGKVKVKAEKEVQFADGLQLDEKTVYAHVRYNVTENKILQLDKTFDIPKIEIPDPDK